MKIEPTAPIDSLLKAISEHLSQSARRQGLKKQQLAELAGVNRNTITAVLKGADMKLSTLIRLSRVLNETEWLLPLLEEPTPSPLEQVKALNKKPAKHAAKRPAARRLGRGAEITR